MRALVYVCLHTCGGLGDRLNGIINSYIVSKQTNRRFFIHAPTTFDSTVVPAGLVSWNATVPASCHNAIQSPINDIDQKHNQKLHKAASGVTACIAVRINQDYHTMAERKRALSALFAPFESPTTPYAAVHLRTGGNGDFKGIDPARNTIYDGLQMISRLNPTWNTVHIISDSVAAKDRLAVECRKTHQSCVYQRRKSRHIDRQPTSTSQLSEVWSDFRDIAGAACLVHSRSGFSEVAKLWPKGTVNTVSEIPCERNSTRRKPQESITTQTTNA